MPRSSKKMPFYAENLNSLKYRRWYQETAWPNLKPQTTHAYTWDSTVTADASGNKNTLTPYNNPNLEENTANCRSGYCIFLDGVGKQYFEAPEFSFGVYPGLSFSGWFKDTGSGNTAHIMDFNNGDSLDNILVSRSSASMRFEVSRPLNSLRKRHI